MDDERVIAGRYTLVRELGHGGMGAVWLAHDDLLGRDVAIKRLSVGPGEAANPSGRAWREGRLAARLSHPNVVAVYDLLSDDEDLWLVMEYVDGPTLARMVADHGPMTPDAAAAVTAQIAAGLAAAHEQGIIHRDVKPSNVLVPEGGPAKLADFGIARGLGGDATVTMSGTVTGSPAYLAPEVATGGAAQPASDVWSLGATLFHLLTGRPPYDDGGNVLGVLYRIVHEPPPQTDRAGWLAPLLAGTMTHDPRARWSLPQIQDYLLGGDSRRPSGAPLAPTTAAPGQAVQTAVMPPVRTAPPAVRRGAPRALWATLGAALAVVVVVLGFVLIRGGTHSGAPPRAGADRSPTDTPSSPAAQTSSPSGGSVAPTTAEGRPTAAGIRSFVTSYLQAASADPARGFRMLTPRYQAQSGGFAGYRSFWGQVTGIHALSPITAHVGHPLEAAYTYSYTRRHHGRVTETVRLRLVYVDGHYLIDGASG